MRVNYYDLFDLIADDAGQLLAEYENNNIDLQQFSPNITKNAVNKQLKRTVKTIKKKKSKLVLRLFIAAITIMALATISIAVYKGGLLKNGAAVIDADNENLIGKELSQEPLVKDKQGNIIQGEENTITIDQLIENSSIIESVENKDIPLNSISYFPVQRGDKNYTTPQIIFKNGSLVVFTQDDGSGWVLNQSDELSFEAEEYPSEINNGQGQDILFGYIYNGKLITENNNQYGLEAKYTIHAKEKGEYYICLIGASSDPITLKSGSIYINKN